jgi:hypothetical protein
MICIGSLIYIFGGFYHGSFMNTTYVIDLEEHEVKFDKKGEHFEQFRSVTSLSCISLSHRIRLSNDSFRRVESESSFQRLFYSEHSFQNLVF